MEKEFVTYTQALALKKLGFDEPCFFAFDNCSTPMRCSDLRTNKQKFYGVNYNNSSYTSQPLYQQAFRWFREKYKLQHHIWSGKINHIFYGYDILNIEEQELVVNNSDIGGGNCDYDTYEEAEQACLDKLIKIVKNK